MSTQLLAGTDHIVLPSAEFENVERLEADRINRKTRGGDVIIFRDPNWTHAKELVVQFTYTTEKKRRDYLDFVKSHLGEIITLIDWEGRTWSGVIVNPNEATGQPGRENHTLGFTFRGSIV